jgi:hypothetical protein
MRPFSPIVIPLAVVSFLVRDSLWAGVTRDGPKSRNGAPVDADIAANTGPSGAERRTFGPVGRDDTVVRGAELDPDEGALPVIIDS